MIKERRKIQKKLINTINNTTYNIDFNNLITYL